MATRTNKRTGEVQEQQPDGSWKTIQPGQSLPSMSVQTRAPDPRIPLQVRKLGNEADASAYAAPKAAADTTSAQADAAFARQVAEAQARKAEADARTAEANANSGNAKAATTVRADAITGYQSAQQLYTIIDGLNAKFLKGPGRTSGLAGAQDYMPYTVNQQFDKAGDAARGIVGQALGFTGGQLNTQREAEAAIGPYLPHADDRDEVIKDKIARLTELAKTAETRAMSILGGRPDPNGNIVPIQAPPDASTAPDGGIDKSSELPGVHTQASTPSATTADGKTRAEVDPALKAVGIEVGNRLAVGDGEGSILKYLSESGIDPNSTNIREAFRIRRTKGFQQWKRQHPGDPYPIGEDFYTKQVPMSETRQLINKAIDTPVGAAAAASLNSITGARLDNMSANPEMTRTGLEAVRSAHPVASTVGDIAGQAELEYAAGRIPGARALLASKWGRRGEDALYGAYSGSGEMDDNSVLGALGGSASGTVFGGLGRSAQRGLGGGLTGVRNDSLAYLNDRDVPLSIGRIARGSDSTFGHAVGGIEERAAGLPIFDAIIGSERRRGDVGFNKAAGREAANIVGKPFGGRVGTEGLQDLAAMKNDAYRFLDPLSFPVDAKFAGGQAGIRAQIPSLIDHGDKVGKTLDRVDRSFQGGAMSGPHFQQNLRSIRSARTGAAKENFGYDAAGLLTDAEGNLMDFAGRSAPGVRDDLATANSLYRHNKVLGDAVATGSAQRNDQLFSAQGLNQSAITSQKRLKMDPNSPDRPFYSLSGAGMDVMPNLTPDSGTAGRSVMYSLLPSILGGSVGMGAGAAYGGASDNMSAGQGAAAGAGIGLGSTLGPTAGLAALYSKPVQRGLQKLLLGKRPASVEATGEFLKKYPKLAGLLAQSMGRDAFFQPELPGN